MAYSSVTYAGDGATSTFATTFSFIDENHVEVYVNERLLLSSEYKWVTTSSIQIRDPQGAPDPPGAGDAIVLKRVTPIASRLVVFTPGSTLTESNLNTSALQLFYLVQEAQENYNLVIDTAIQGVATGAGIVTVEGEVVLDNVVANILNDATAAEIQQRITDIDTNAADILSNLGDIVSLQSSVAALAGSISAGAIVQAAEPVPGVAGVANPIVDTTRWYDSDDSNHPYIWLPTNLVTAALQWTATGNPSEYYVELSGGGNPTLTQPQQVEENDAAYLTAGTPPLAAAEWAWGDGGGGFNTVIVRLTDSTDPDTKATGYVEAYDWLDLEDPRIGANESAITALEVTVNDGTTGVAANAAAVAVLDATVITLDGDITAVAGSVTALNVEVDANAASIITEQSTRANADTAIATDLSLLGAANAGGTAFVVDTTTVKMDTDGGATLASHISQINTHDGQFARTTSSTLNTALTTAEGTITSLEAHYGVTLNVNNYITGFTLLNDGATGTFDILTDKFRIVDPAAGGTTPRTIFAIESGNAYLTNLYLGEMNLSSTGHIKSGQTAYNTGTGFWLGNDSGTPKFSIGVGTGNRMTWDGSTLNVVGDLAGSLGAVDAKVKTAGESVTSSTTFQADDHLTGFALEADTWYTVSWSLEVYAANTTPDFKMRLGFTQTPSSNGHMAARSIDYAGNIDGDSDVSCTGQLEFNVYSRETVNRGSASFKSHATTGGTMGLEWAQRTSSATSTSILSGSWMKVQKTVG